MPADPIALALMAAAVVLAYAVFGLTGFGATMVGVPVLVQVVPLQFAVPLMLLLDLVTTALVGLRNRRHVSGVELRRLLPFLVLGVFVGATLLARVASHWLLIGLGVFVLAMAARSLLALRKPPQVLHAGWVVPAGVVGGVFSALFGTGGPVYTMYLSRRLPDLDVFRATIASVVLASALVRLGAFAATGLLLQPGLLKTALLALPCALLGLGLGSLLRRRLPQHAVKRALFVLLAAGGAGVLYRGLTGL